MQGGSCPPPFFTPNKEPPREKSSSSAVEISRQLDANSQTVNNHHRHKTAKRHRPTSDKVRYVNFATTVWH